MGLGNFISWLDDENDPYYRGGGSNDSVESNYVEDDTELETDESFYNPDVSEVWNHYNNYFGQNPFGGTHHDPVLYPSAGWGDYYTNVWGKGKKK